MRNWTSTKASKMADDLQQGMLRKTIPASSEDAICPNSVFLDAGKRTTFGRTASSQTDVRLLSRKTPLMISRTHASIACENRIWTILDHNSLNGVYLNGEKVPANVPQQIKAGDRICFGVAVENNVHEFDYTFQTYNQTDGHCFPQQRQNIFDSEVAKRKRKLDVTNDKDTKICKVLQESVSNMKSEPGPSGEKFMEGTDTVFSKTLDKIKESEKKIERLRLLLSEKEKAYQKQIEEKEKDLVTELNSKLKEKDEELTTQLKEKDAELTTQLKEKDAELTQLKEKDAELTTQLKEKDDKLRTQLKEKDKELMTQLKAQRDRLESILQSRVDEQMKLQEELNREKIEQEKLQAEEMAKKNLVEQMEDEFTCIICHELFIQATTLACSHSFCDYCLKLWLKKEKSCPICRKNTNGASVRSIVLDSAVDKIVEKMEESQRNRRDQVTEERKKLNQEIVVIKDNQGTDHHNPIVISAGGNDEVQIVNIPPTNQPQLIRRQPGHGHQRRRLPGNSHCFICGMLGHFARRCPFR